VAGMMVKSREKKKPQTTKTNKNKPKPKPKKKKKIMHDISYAYITNANYNLGVKLQHVNFHQWIVYPL